MKLKWTETNEGMKWESGEYHIRLGINSDGAAMPANMSDVYHCYYNDAYIAQGLDLNDAKSLCESHAGKVTTK